MTHEHSPCLLILNAAEGRLQMILARSETPGSEPSPLCAQEWHAPSQGAELLAPALQEACAHLKIAPSHIRRIACVSGPGSFTGLRLCLATAAGLARAVGALQAGMPYLPLLAKNAAKAALSLAPEQSRELVFWPITHARKNLVHAQAFLLRNSVITPDSDIFVLSREEAAERIARRGDRPVLLGSGVTRAPGEWQELFALHGIAPLVLPEAFNHPDPATLLEEARHCAFGPADIPPLYARPCDAEENLGSIAPALGLDPDAAREALAELATAKLTAVKTPGNSSPAPG